ncbi:MAG: hypothetical protein JAY67_22860 [Candidatus Thiodiazotropha taylori]|nr:hypothetical protein [Candidatus Thiodiazotropha taylori]MCG7926460.1 hypothetical protein [Candidatus Thiodiazotropha taylori]MCG7928366.1 hypothetical protein [Candidatus Thiodiazotropha taylori]MCG7935500.1 hypothetical protein [Candidatus Thiodiazotropha taylori]
MWIFYKHLPKNVTLKEIQNVTLKGARSNWSPLSIFNKPSIKRTKIIRIRDLQKDSIEYHAIIQVNPTSVTDTIIENLDGRTVNGLYLRPHRYHRRFTNRDRRNMQSNEHQSGERRKSDRRRDNLVTRVMAID